VPSFPRARLGERHDLRLEYRKTLLWKDFRKTMTPCELELKVPLFRLSYFQPAGALGPGAVRLVWVGAPSAGEQFVGLTSSCDRRTDDG